MPFFASPPRPRRRHSDRRRGCAGFPLPVMRIAGHVRARAPTPVGTRRIRLPRREGRRREPIGPEVGRAPDGRFFRSRRGCGVRPGAGGPGGLGVVTGALAIAGKRGAKAAAEVGDGGIGDPIAEGSGHAVAGASREAGGRSRSVERPPADGTSTATGPSTVASQAASRGFHLVPTADTDVRGHDRVDCRRRGRGPLQILRSGRRTRRGFTGDRSHGGPAGGVRLRRSTTRGSGHGDGRDAASGLAPNSASDRRSDALDAARVEPPPRPGRARGRDGSTRSEEAFPAPRRVRARGTGSITSPPGSP